MFEEEKNKSSLISNKSEKVRNSNQKTSRIAYFMDKVHSLNGIHLISALFQVILGVSVVALSLLNSIQPLWLATVMAVLGSITTMIGLYLTFHIFTHDGGFDSLIHKAIKRVINFQN